MLHVNNTTNTAVFITSSLRHALCLRPPDRRVWCTGEEGAPGASTRPWPVHATPHWLTGRAAAEAPGIEFRRRVRCAGGIGGGRHTPPVLRFPPHFSPRHDGRDVLVHQAKHHRRLRQGAHGTVQRKSNVCALATSCARKVLRHRPVDLLAQRAGRMGPIPITPMLRAVASGMIWPLSHSDTPGGADSCAVQLSRL